MVKRSRVAEPQDGFSIRAVARMTSVEPDTLRMWERRYGFPKPSRTAGGARVYSAADVETLRLIARAQKQGFRAGEVVGRTKVDLVALLETAGLGDSDGVPSPAARRTPLGDGVDEQLDALARGDVTWLRRELRKAALGLGPKRFVTDLAAPLAVKLGMLWETGQIAIHQEHLMTELLTTELRLLLAASEELGADRSVLLATPVGEMHGLGLEMVAVYLAYHQVQPRLLGVDTPASQIVDAARSLRVDAVGLTISEAADPGRATPEVEAVARRLGAATPCWLGGTGASKLRVTAPSVRVLAAWADLDEAVRDLRRQPEQAAPASRPA